jgi:hypothetical protein
MKVDSFRFRPFYSWSKIPGTRARWTGGWMFYMRKGVMQVSAGSKIVRYLRLNSEGDTRWPTKKTWVTQEVKTTRCVKQCSVNVDSLKRCIMSSYSFHAHSATLRVAQRRANWLLKLCRGVPEPAGTRCGGDICLFALTASLVATKPQTNFSFPRFQFLIPTKLWYV